ncbi:amino acid transporter AVT1F-like isoform X2 [Lytechinus variegatus]|uniref:amino acid transporter AVT1F-like isoform X2 n=1 Tax=Lytechinus variegatus TaxID=7654 RepID=UPI001BB23C7A|nr:amino acid transporter AVT1F-like isoform X2 [Lytechinus variegatus]
MASDNADYPLMLEKRKSYGGQDSKEDEHIENTSHSSQFSHGGLSIMSATALISGKIAGLGIQILPGAISRTGVWGLIVAIVALLLSAFSGTLLSKSWIILRHRFSKYRTEIHRYPYPALAYEGYGIWGRRIASVLLYLYGVAICTTGLLILADNLDVLLNLVGVRLTVCSYLPIVAVCVCPFLWMGTPKDFWFAGYFAVITATTAGGFLFIGALLDHEYYSNLDNHGGVETAEVLSSMGDIIFAYAGQSVYPTVQHDMRNPEDFTTSVLFGYAEFTWKRCLLRSLYVLFLLVIATTFPHFTTFLPLVGGPLVAVVNFILPIVIYAKLVSLEPPAVAPESIIPACLTNTCHVIIVIVAIVGAGMSSGTALYRLIMHHNDVYLPCYANISSYYNYDM